MAFGAILKETGRATHDEIRRIRQRLDILEGFGKSLTQSLIRSGNPQGPVGTGNIFLRLDATNDPVTGPLLLGSNLRVQGSTILEGKTSMSATLNVDPTTDTDVGVRIKAQADIDTTSPNALANQGNLMFWFEAEDLNTLSDGTGVTTWHNKATGLTAQHWLQNSAGDKPLFKNDANHQTPTGLGCVESASSDIMAKAGGGIDWKFGADTSGDDRNSWLVLIWRSSDSLSSINRTLGDSGGSEKQGFRTPNQTNQGIQVMDSDTAYTVGATMSTLGTNEWHASLIYYNGSDSAYTVYLDGAASVGPVTVQDVDLKVDWLFKNRNTGGTAGSVDGHAVAAMAMAGYGGSGAETTLDEAKAVYNDLTGRYMGSAYQIGNAAGKALDVWVDGATKTWIDGSGNLVVGGNCTVTGNTVVSGTAAITGNVTMAAALNVAGTLTVGGPTDLQALQVDGAAVLSGTLRVQDDITHDGNEFNGQTTTFHVGAIQMDDNVKLRMGTAKDSRLYYDGTDTILELQNVGTGHLKVKAGNVDLDADNQFIRFGASLDASIGWNAADLEMAISAGALRVIAGTNDGILVANNETASTNKVMRLNTLPYDTAQNPVTGWVLNANAGANTLNIGGSSSIEQAVTGIEFWTAGAVNTGTGTNQWAIIANGNLRNEAANDLDMQSGNILLDDNAAIQLGTGIDADILFDGTNLVIDPRRSGSGNTRFNDGTWYTEIDGSNGRITVVNTAPGIYFSELGQATTSDAQIRVDGGELQIRDHAGTSNKSVINIHTTAAAGPNSAGAFVFRDDDLQFDNDNAGVVFGEGQDARIDYDGTDLVIDPQVVGSGNVKIASPAVIEGDRQSFQAAKSVTADSYYEFHGRTFNSNFGVPMVRPGSVLGFSVNWSEVVTTAHDNVTVHVYKNGASILSTTFYSTVTSAVVTQARGTDTFVAGDLLQVYVDVGASFNATHQSIVNVDYIYDE